jgi:ABC-type sugar transport system, ATPase component
MRNVSKRFGTHEVLKDVSCTVAPAEFVGLMGPNGAGKSTLIKIIGGVHTPDRGIALAGGKQIMPYASPVAVLHQQASVVESLTVQDNLCLGATALQAINPARPRAEYDWAAAQLGNVGLSPDILRHQLGSLSLGEQTLVAIARLLSRGAPVLVVDEATSALPPSEVERLIRTLRSANDSGTAIIFVSHKLSEIIDVADRQLVLIDGSIVFDSREELLSAQELTMLMSPGLEARAAVSRNDAPTGGDVPHHGATFGSLRRKERPRTLGRQEPGRPADPAVKLINACGRTTGPFDLDLRSGEVIGVTGRVGGGMYELAMLCAGRGRPRRGRVVLREGMDVGFVPPDRETEAALIGASVLWNLTISSLHLWRTRTGLLNLTNERAAAAAVHERLGVVPEDLDVRQELLSGGNQQKVIMARSMLRNPGCYVLCEPTRGVDVRTRAQIYDIIRELAQAGAAILIVSSDVTDIVAVSDQVAAVEGGKLSRLWPTSDLGVDELMKLV